MTQKIIPFAKWALRAWAFLVVATMGGAHYFLFKLLDTATSNWLNSLVAAVLQIAGGLIVLYSLNQNIGMFKKQHLGTMVFNWIRECPLYRKSRTINLRSSVIGVSDTSEVTLQVTRNFNTVEEQLIELQRQIDECRQLVFEKEKKLTTSLDKLRGDLKNDISSVTGKVEEVNNQLQDAVIGGIKVQVFGVLLVIYGAVVGVM